MSEHGSEVGKREAAEVPMSGDSIIEKPDVAWDTTIVVPRGLEEVWSGQFGLTRVGLVDEGGHGMGFPQKLDPVLPKKFRSLPDGAPLPYQLRIGDSVPDGHKDDRAIVREIDYEGSERAIVFETRWGESEHRGGQVAAAVASGLAARHFTKDSSSKIVRRVTPVVGALIGVALRSKNQSFQDEREPLHYTWQLVAKAGDLPDTTIITARTRMAHVRHPVLTRKFGPHADRFAMRMIKEGLLRNATPHNK